MEYRESLARVIDVWKARYPDIPWGPQQIRVPVSIEGDRLHFIALCPGLDSQPKVHFSVFSEKKDDSPRITDGVNFVIRALEDCGGYMISVDQLWTGRVQSIALSQSEHAIRICPIVIMQYLESSSEWIVIYNSHDRTCDLVKEINKILFSVNTPLFENARIFLEEMLNRNFNRAAHYARQLDNEVLTRIFFRWVCDRFQIDFNAHGAKRTFRFWSNTERQNYLNRALDVINVLRSISDDICLGYGAILGHRREGRLLQHDDDLDVLIGIEAAKDVSLGATLDNIAQVLERSGFRVKGYFFAHLWVEIDETTGKTLDVFVAMLEGDRASSYPSRRKSLARATLFPARLGLLEGVAVPMPADVDGYLEGVYGRHWLTPDRGFRHPWDRREYSDLNGARRHKVIVTSGELSTLKIIDPPAAERLLKAGKRVKTT